ncbi:hypothetical protein CF645_17750 [Burkholderia pseudomallei]|nr:hypothetical protein BHT10_29850 [Burkholderia pseudomallei]EEP50051.1 hypothetical protein GBP346_B0047 [Burkholderia pseudomallei MSHR346]PNW94913.1 hypothetical protein CF640_14295 [Burkholderia pseudomallei]PNX08625.1 hypothetical protein CF641_08425 [Burkholderia pseudomallei]PNX20875.1 hypothetical protein CF645_17750 [Burkholderia pseudomallei]
MRERAAPFPFDGEGLSPRCGAPRHAPPRCERCTAADAARRAGRGATARLPEPTEQPCKVRAQTRLYRQFHRGHSKRFGISVK